MIGCDIGPQFSRHRFSAAESEATGNVIIQ
jgi:hypothetical protein